MSVRILVTENNPKGLEATKILGKSPPFIIKMNAHDVARHWSSQLPEVYVSVYDGPKLVWMFKDGVMT